ncbi:MAG: hypothetical protein P1V97_22380 [Planctomycetota bacterium]|nr:hypothetical protein [Planctomycetota bacterium]
MLMNLHDDESGLKPESVQELSFERDLGADDSRELRLLNIGMELPQSFSISDSDAAFESLELGVSAYI